MREFINGENNVCLVPVGKSFEDISPIYDIDKEQNKLNTLRDESLNYLKDSISV